MRDAPRVWNGAVDRRRVIRAAGGATIGAAVLMPRTPSTAANAQASPVPITPGADWPLALGNPARTGVAVDPGPEGEPELIWRFETGLSGTMASPVIVDGMVLSAGGLLGSAALVGLDLQTGDVMWSLPMDFQPFKSAPVVVDGVVYSAGLQGEVAAFDLATQEQRWLTILDAGTTSSPVVADGLLCIGANDDHLYVLDIADGSERWRFAVGAGSEYTFGPSPAYASGSVYFPSASSESDNGLYAVDALTGEEIWHFGPDRPGLFTPAVAEGVAYLGGDGGDVYAVDTGSGERRWKTTVSSAWSAPAVTGDSVFIQTMDGILACLDRESGELRWRVETAASWSSPVIAGQLAYVGSSGLWFEMGLYALDRATGNQQWHVRVDGVTAPAAISGNVVVVGTDEGAICAISGSTADAVSRGANGEGTFLTRIVFSTEVDENNMPIDPADAFPAQTSSLRASFSFVGMQYEAAWEAIWTLNGQPGLTRSESWAQGSSGRLAESLTANEGNLPTGRYDLELRVNGTPVRRGTAIIG